MAKLKHKHFSINHGLTLLLLGIFIDLLTKNIFFSLSSPVDLGLIHLVQHKNFGFIFGAFSDLKNLVRVVFFSTLGGYSVALYVVLIFFFSKQKNFWP